MLFWVLLAAMLGAAVLTVLAPLSRSRRIAEGATDVAFYRDQLEEIARDEGRRLISAGEAEAARAEAGRRLLRATGQAERPADEGGERFLRRRRIAAAALLVTVPAVSLGVYGATGSPGLADRPTIEGASVSGDADDLVSRVEKRLASAPDDREGWRVVAPIYLRAGRFDDARRAYSNLIRLGAEGADELGGLAEAMIGGDGGLVSAEARQILDRARQQDAEAPRVLFYLGLAAEQDGRTDAARATYEGILSRAPPDAGYRSIVEARLAGLSRDARPARLGGEAPPEIVAMVDGLDRRLAASGGTADEWLRLVRAMTVLSRNDDARDRLAKARIALASDAEALTSLDRLALDLQLEAGKRP